MVKLEILINLPLIKKKTENKAKLCRKNESNKMTK